MPLWGGGSTSVWGGFGYFEYHASGGADAQYNDSGLDCGHDYGPGAGYGQEASLFSGMKVCLTIFAILCTGGIFASLVQRQRPPRRRRNPVTLVTADLHDIRRYTIGGMKTTYLWCVGFAAGPEPLIFPV